MAAAPTPEASRGDPERGDRLRSPCATFWGGTRRSSGALGEHADDIAYVLVGGGFLAVVMFGLSYAASLPWAPTHTEELCGDRRAPDCVPFNATMYDMTWRSMGIGFGLTLACAAAVSACALLCCWLYACEDARKRGAVL